MFSSYASVAPPHSARGKIQTVECFKSIEKCRVPAKAKVLVPTELSGPLLLPPSLSQPINEGEHDNYPNFCRKSQAPKNHHPEKYWRTRSSTCPPVLTGPPFVSFLGTNQFSQTWQTTKRRWCTPAVRSTRKRLALSILQTVEKHYICAFDTWTCPLANCSAQYDNTL